MSRAWARRQRLLSRLNLTGRKAPTTTGKTKTNTTNPAATKSRRSARRRRQPAARLAGECGRLGLSDEAEPSLGWTGHGHGHPEMALRGYDDDREHDDEREEDHDFEEDYGR